VKSVGSAYSVVPCPSPIVWLFYAVERWRKIVVGWRSLRVVNECRLMIRGFACKKEFPRLVLNNNDVLVGWGSRPVLRIVNECHLVRSRRWGLERES
jgi:hypothetical protein